MSAPADIEVGILIIGKCPNHEEQKEKRQEKKRPSYTLIKCPNAKCKESFWNDEIED